MPAISIPKNLNLSENIEFLDGCINPSTIHVSELRANRENFHMERKMHYSFAVSLQSLVILLIREEL